ncbi:NADH dehydrogenase [ubiquinone] 1 alpha subcomplex subunit 10 mitochondrial [Biomphalaria glabrata]|uniref:Deoxynucleoside kinase domain-containing protein n=1 Tax=Biomphalaria glabrata TaxID=6526 RepID=A0A2C9KT28_BIOGL|nr:NADH dehydrogenase [ubiquinone] 1 alpha subcomplex subunit 10; mitochondrial-like [Biomphalaria glabrata]
MSLLLARTSLILRLSTKKPSLLIKGTSNSLIAPSSIHVAHLTAYGGSPPQRKKPWPYKEKGFRYWHIPFDRVDSRLDDNSKIIIIDGNVASGKTELGQKIAKEFDMLYVPDFNNSDMCDLIPEKGFDLREFDPQVPVKTRTCDFEKFYSRKAPKKILDNFPREQYILFRRKLYRFAQKVMAHFLSTGQGIVMNRGMWSDIVFAHTLAKQGYMSQAALKAYKYQYEVATDYFWHPHLIIYLDAPVSFVRDRIKKRNVPWEVNSPVLTDEFLNTMNEVYKTVYLPHMRNHCEILSYNLAENPVLDFDLIVEEMESLDLDNAPREHEQRFEDWKYLHNTDYNNMRSFCSPNNTQKLDEIFTFYKPFEAPELVLDGYDEEIYYETLQTDPRIKYLKPDRVFL